MKWPLVTGLALAAFVNSYNSTQIKPQEGTEPELNPLYSSPTQNVTSYANAVNIASPAVVNIYTLTKQTRPHPLASHPLYQRLFNRADLPQQERMSSALGSGVIVHEDGYLLTNNHVVRGADRIVVQLQDGRESTAEIVGEDKQNDLAVLKIMLGQLTAIPIGSPEKAQVGDIVLAIGNPFGRGQSVTQGIVSAKGRYGFTENTFENFIQTDAAINQGNSGGALIDVNGNLLGINTTVVDRVGSDAAFGVGLAIPADIAMRSLKDIVEVGRVIHGWLGVEARALTPQRAHALKLRISNGLLITSVYKNGPADSAGLQIGDVIIKVNDRVVGDGRRSSQVIAQSAPGDLMTLEVYRNNEVHQVQVTLGSKPALQ